MIPQSCGRGKFIDPDLFFARVKKVLGMCVVVLESHFSDQLKAGPS